jgi:hypothetical protein
MYARRGPPPLSFFVHLPLQHLPTPSNTCSFLPSLLPSFLPTFLPPAFLPSPYLPIFLPTYATHQPSHPQPHVATQPPSHPATNPPSHPVTQPTSQPANQPPSHRATEPHSHPATQPRLRWPPRTPSSWSMIARARFRLPDPAGQTRDQEPALGHHHSPRLELSSWDI